MIKILSSADWHVNLHKKKVPYDWQTNRFQLMFDKMRNLESSCDVHIIAGDLFDKKPEPDETLLVLSYQNSVAIPTYIIPGNHEAAKKGETFWEHFTLENTINNPNVRVFTRNSRAVLGSQGFCFFPYGSVQTDSLPTYVDFSFGGATKTSIWLPTTYQLKKLVITLTSTTVTAIDCARLICGTYWESTRQASNGIQLGYEDLSEITTTRSGNTYEDRKPISETMQFDLEYLPDADRKQLQTLMRSWGSSALIYYCIFPSNTNPELTQSYSIYGRSNSNSLQYQFFSFYNTNLDIKSW